jgi:Tfp pilus assembly protein PilO
MHIQSQRTITTALLPVAFFSCIVLVALLIALFYSIPEWKRLHVNMEKHAFLKSAVHVENPEAIQYRLSVKKDSLTKIMALISGQATPNKTMAEALKMLISHANSSGIQFVKMQPQEESSQKAMSNYPIVLDVSASYHKLGHFISSLESQPFAVCVNRLAITATRGDMINARILVTCFIKSNKEHHE